MGTLIALTAICFALAGILVFVLRQHAEERRHLLDRIQAPQEVVVQRLTPTEDDPEPAHWDEEKAFWHERGIED